MKKKITKIWGIGLVVVLVASLLSFAAPVSAGELSFGAEVIPSTTGTRIAPQGFDIIDMSVSGDGETIWAVGPGSEGIYWEYTTVATTTPTANASVLVTYTDQDGTSVNATAFTVTTTAAVGDTGAITLANTTDTVRDITAVAISGWTGSAPGVISIKGSSSLATLASDTLAAAFVDGAIPKSIFKSTDAGVTFTGQSTPTGINTVISLVAVAPDDAEIVAVAADTDEIYITKNGGTTWGTLGTVQPGTGTNPATAFYDLDISADSAGTHYIAAAGTGGTDLPGIYVFDSGAAAPGWKNAALAASATDWVGGPEGVASLDSFRAVKFSPNFASDQVMTAVSEELAAAGGARFHIASFNTKTWDTPAGFPSQYPISLEAGTVATVDKAAIALAPDYLGGDDALRIAFVGASIDTAGAEVGGIYRLKDYTMADIKAASPIGSIAYDGVNLVAGAWTSTDATPILSNAVYRCDEPLVTTPTFSSTSSLKRPGGSSAVVTNVIVAWANADVVAGCAGDESAFAVSKNNGKSFSDISLIETTLTSLTDVAVSADGSTFYLATDDGADFSLWRNAGAWERILAVDGKTDFIVRLAPEDNDVIYAVDKGTTSIYYASDADEKWFTRTGRYSVQDLAVESADVAYIGVNNAKTVSKSTNSGFTWATAKSTALVSGNVHSIVSLGEDNLIVGSTVGYVSYSTDGNASWTKISKQLESGALLTQVTASGLADDDYIYAASSLAATSTTGLIVRWQIGTSTAWKSVSATPTATYSIYGLELVDGALYAVSSNTTNSEVIRNLSPTNAAPSAGHWSLMASAGEDFDAAPQALNVSAGSNKLWMVDKTADALFSFTDTLADTGPTLTSPADERVIAVNPVSGVSYDASLSWERLSKADAYQVDVALDDGFGEKVVNLASVATTLGAISYVVDGSTLMPNTTYFWRVRVSSTEADTTVFSPFSETRSVIIGELPDVAPVVVKQIPPPTITIPPAPPAPQITLQPPDIIIPPAPPAPEIVIPPAPPAPAPITPAFIWAIVIIGAILVIAVIVLIVRTRRPI